MISAILKSVISLFLIILVGFYGSKKKIITRELNKGLIDLLLNIALPIMVVSSFMFTFDDLIKGNVFKAFYYSFAAYLIMIAFSYLLIIPVKCDKRLIIHFANIFTNTGYIGFPVLNAIFGPEGVVYGSIFNMFFVIFVWTYGINIFRGKIEKEYLKQEIIKAILNPSVIAVVIGVIILIFNLKIPNILMQSINSIGSMTGPLSMIIVGASLSNIKSGNHLLNWKIYYGIVTRLIIIPTILYVFSLLICDTSIVADSVIIIASMPAATMTSIFAESYEKEKDFATITVLATTLLSIFTIPLLIRILV
jgi:hypothetical protein